ncbi:hypothetical protein F4782DRAFT_44270 [Xylaria castorea]|nr:hypothetical protein F4782DRAFT_44270 [Xylaria castorea]
MTPAAWDLLPSIDDPVTRSLTTLRKVKLMCNHRINYEFDLSKMTSIFSHAANVDTLTIFRCWGVSCTPSLQNVTCLIPQDCTVSTRCMSRLLSSCRKLNTFAYHSEVATDDYEDAISANELVWILGQQGHSRTLRISSLDYTESFHESIDSLIGFSQLHTLWLWSVYFGPLGAAPKNPQAELLPASLEEIGLYNRRRRACSLVKGNRSTMEWIADQSSNGFFPGRRRSHSTISSWKIQDSGSNS